MMKEASWDECLESGIAMKIAPDKLKAKSLTDTSEERMIFLNKNKIDESNARFIFENYYTSVIELIHALTLIAGFKVDNHVCLGFYLRDILKLEALYRTFDECRYKRNSIVYYGKKIEFGIAKESIDKIRRLIAELRTLFK